MGVTTEVDCTRAMIDGCQHGKCETDPPLTHCLCGIVPLRWAVIIFSICDTVNMLSMSLSTFMPSGSIRNLIFPFIPFTLFAVCSVLGVIGGITRNAEFTRYYALAVIFFPIVCAIMSVICCAGSVYLLSMLGYLLYGWWKYVVSQNCARVFRSGGSGDDAGHQLLR